MSSVASKGLSIIGTISSDLHDAWTDINDFAEEDLDDLWSWGGTLLHQFAVAELAVLRNAAFKAIKDVAANPLLIATPGAEFTAVLNNIVAAQPGLLTKINESCGSREEVGTSSSVPVSVPDEVSNVLTTILGLAHMTIGSTPANPTAHIAPPAPITAATAAPIL